MLIPFGAYLPDRAKGDHLLEAENVWTRVDGYAPVMGYRAFTTSEVAGWTGGGAFIASDGVSSLLAGNATNLYRYNGSGWTSVYSGGGETWRFAQFGDNIICVNGGSPVSFNAAAYTAANTGGSPPDADMVAVVRDHVILAGDPLDNKTVTWSAFNNSNGWTSGSNQSGFQPMLEGGEVMGLAGGEYGIILQRNAIKRMDYLGDDALVFSFGEISSNIGCMAKGSVAQAGRLVFFLSERGFMVCDGSDVQPIGFEQVDETFFTRYDRGTIASVKAAVDPRQFVVMWAMPDMIWIYNWVLKLWSTIKIVNLGVFQGFTSSVSLDSLDATYPDLDAMTIGLDSPAFSGGDPVFFVVAFDGVIGTFSNALMTPRFVTTERDLSLDRLRARSVRVLTDADTVGVNVLVKSRADQEAVIKPAAARRENADMPIRANGRHWQFETTLGGAWNYANGLNVEFESGGKR